VSQYRQALQSRLLPVALLCLLGAALRLWQLDFQPLWGDEGWSFYFAAMPISQMMEKTAIDIHPPLYYLILGVWLSLIGFTPEAGRLLSVVFGILLIPLTYEMTRRISSREAAFTSAAVVTLAPFAIYYSQEVRMYGLVTLLGLASSYFLVRCLQDQTRCGPVCIGYILTTTAALYTMYYAVFLVAAQALLLIAGWIAAARSIPPSIDMHKRYRTLLASMSAVVVLYLPWIFYAGTRLLGYVQGKREAEGYVSLTLFEFLRSHFVAFSAGHLSEGLKFAAWGALFFAALALLGIRCLLTERERRPAATIAVLPTVLLVPLLLGFAVNLIFPFTPLYFERTLMLTAPAFWILTGLGLLWLRGFSKGIFWTAAAALAVTAAIGLHAFYTVPRYRDDDYRQLLTVVEAHSTPQDVLLASYQWQKGLYHAYLPSPHPVFYEVPNWGAQWAEDPIKMQNDLKSLLLAHPRLWFPAYQSLGRLWETDVERTLNRIAYPAAVDWRVPNTKLLLYGSASSTEDTAETAAASRFRPNLILEHAAIGKSSIQSGRGIVPVSLTWRILEPIDDEYHILLRLTDPSGFTWSNRDSLPQGGTASFTEMLPGEPFTDHHGLLVPAGTPPGTYQLRLSVSPEQTDLPLDILDSQGQPQGTEITLAEVQVLAPMPPVLPEALPPYEKVNAHFGKTIQLLGYSQPKQPVQAGNTVQFSLFWQGLAPNPTSYIGFAQLQDETGQPVALSEVPPIQPTDTWEEGTLLRDPREIPLPAGLPAGRYKLVVGLMQANGTRLKIGHEDQVILTTLQTEQRSHSYEPPSVAMPHQADFGNLARLVGYDLPASSRDYVEPGSTIDLTLAWQAIGESDRAYSVFVHLVDNQGSIFGQRDQVPGQGAYPTTSWVEGEYLIDYYAFPIYPDTPAGVYTIEIGFYNPQDGTRLPVTDNAIGTMGDHLLLTESPITVR
jgi:hypothetical protein